MSGYKGVECQSLEKDDDIIEIINSSEELEFIIENEDLLSRCLDRSQIIIEANDFCAHWYLWVNEL